MIEGAKESRKLEWGMWSLSPLHPGPTKAFVGWGANCGCHKNDDDRPSTRCQTSLRSGHGGLSADEARLAMKKWLLLGAYIDADAPDARRQHMKLRHDGSIFGGDVTEEELDLQAAAFAPPA